MRDRAAASESAQKPPSGSARSLIQVVRNGPFRVTGVPLVRMRPVYDEHGDGIEWERGDRIPHEETYELCRCGRSGRMPFCDGTERRIGFEAPETADRRPSSERRRSYGEGPLVLTDDRTLCSHMGFCSRGRSNAWSLARGPADEDARGVMVSMVRRCPSGRLQYLVPPNPDPVEEDLDPEIGVVEGGPLWVRGGVPVMAADGFAYEIRNRVALCACGRSRNMPVCDGSHWEHAAGGEQA